MSRMVNGEFFAGEFSTAIAEDGTYERERANIRNWITRDGSPGPTGIGGFAPEPGRYHLYVAWNCPWAHRAILGRLFKKLEGDIALSIAKPRRTDQGWVYDESGEFSDPLYGLSAVHEIYARHPDPYTGPVTVPVLWDTQREMAVSNESADILRMFGQVWNRGIDLCPADLIPQIDDWNARIYKTVNNGVYQAGFARTQPAYETAAHAVFETLDAVEAHLADNRYLCGDAFTEADIRLFTTLARFDAAYHYAFKCNLRRLVDYPNLWGYAREIYQMDGVAATVKPDIYRRGYFSPSKLRNPLGIVPIGPQVDWTAPHGRG